MRKQWKRLVFAASLSGLGLLVTYSWYFATQRKFVVSDAVPVAQVGHVGDEVLRRPTTRLLWHNVNTGDQLYSGEAIRTSPLGEVRIQFEDGKFIDLESDSLIVLQKSQGEIALDLMEGSLFVNAKTDEKTTVGDKAPEEKKSNIVLKSASGKIELSGANASLSKSQSGKVDLQVLEGKAKLQGKDGQTKELGQGSVSALGSQGLQVQNINLQVISPTPNGKIFIDPSADKPVLFSWKGLPPTWIASIYAGTNRRELREWIPGTEATTKLNGQFPLGKYFWKIVAKDPATQKVAMESPIYKMDLFPRSSPTVIFPTSNAFLEYEDPTYTMAFKWQKTEEVKQILIEVAKDPGLKNKVTSKNFSEEESFEIPNFADGDYYWRLVAYYPGSDKPLLGKIQKFTILKKIKKQKEALQSEWDLSRGGENQFFIEKPEIDLAWLIKNRTEDVSQYKVRLNEESASAETSQVLDVKDPKAKVVVRGPGRYIAAVEVYDKNGERIGDLPQRFINVAEFPLLPAPKFIGEGPFKADGNGKSQIVWEEVKGAKNYQLQISTAEGKVILDKKYRMPAASVTSMPGEYKVQVVAIDEHGRNGNKDEPRALIVPDKSSLKAPTLKGIRVK